MHRKADEKHQSQSTFSQKDNRTVESQGNHSVELIESPLSQGDSAHGRTHLHESARISIQAGGHFVSKLEKHAGRGQSEDSENDSHSAGVSVHSQVQVVHPHESGRDRPNVPSDDGEQLPLESFVALDNGTWMRLDVAAFSANVANSCKMLIDHILTCGEGGNRVATSERRALFLLLTATMVLPLFLLVIAVNIYAGFIAPSIKSPTSCEKLISAPFADSSPFPPAARG